jgi:hypothetical protein
LKKFADIGLDNAGVYGRTQSSKGHFEKLLPVAAHPGGEHRLLRCPHCGQLWQASHARHWGDAPYLFKVPAADRSGWMAGPYLPPDELVDYNRAILSYTAGTTFVGTAAACKRPQCGRQAVELSVFCKRHHIEMMQRSGALASPPAGRLFEPYFYDEDECLFKASRTEAT